MQKPILHVFLISHYCEKARWALDLCGVEYQLSLLSPLSHASNAKKIGAKRSSLPILETSTGVIQGSAEIIKWANDQARINERPGLLITPESKAIEKRLDDVLGIHVRRWFYSEALLDCPETVRPVFAHGSGLFGRLTLRLAWPKVVASMVKRMGLGVDQENESKEIVSSELDWLDSLLENDSSFLTGGALSNADIAAASLMAPMLSPESHPASGLITLPPRASELAEQWSQRPFTKWLTELYSARRISSPDAAQ
jgi:glutathione S-transferase